MGGLVVTATLLVVAAILVVGVEVARACGNFVIAAAAGRGAMGLLGALAPFAWPLLGLGILLAFRDQLRELIGRIRVLSPKDGLRFDPAAATQQQRSPEQPQQPIAIQPRRSYSRGAHDLVPLLKRNIASEVPDPQEREGALFFELAETRIRLFFEQTYTTSFGSQLRALRAMAEMGGPIDVRPFHEQHAAAAKAIGGEPLEFDRWLHFLVGQGFAQAVSEERAAALPLGTDLLAYLVTHSRPVEKSAW